MVCIGQRSLKTSDRQKRQVVLVLFVEYQFYLHSCIFTGCCMYLARLLLIVHLVFPLCIYLTLDLQHSVQDVWKKWNSFPGVLAYVI